MGTTLGVLTSGGDAQGMNAAVRGVVRAALDRNLDVYGIYEGYAGMILGGTQIRKLSWNSVGGILHRGGTVIGSARSQEFRTRAGRLQAAQNLLEHGIQNLVVIGGDGSLTGANLFREEWSGLLQELVEQKRISSDLAAAHPSLGVVGLVGSIDNDMFGTDMTIGADTALHRIVEAVDAISSTAASHQRTFVVEVMGRRCGYLALMGALASGADWVLIPESPPNLDQWEEKMCEVLKMGRDVGRRDSIVIVAEGAIDRRGNPITCGYVKQVLEEQLGEDARITILGHVQRGGAPSAYDRNISTLMGVAAVEEVLTLTPESPPSLIGVHNNRIVRSPLMHCVEQTQAVNEAIKSQNFERAMELRGRSFQEAFRTVRTLIRAFPHPPQPGKKRLRLVVMHAGGPAPGMNIAVRAAVRLGVDRGHTLIGVRNGFEGLVKGEMAELDWMSVNGWATIGGAELGTNRYVPVGGDFYAIARNIEEQKIDGILMIGGWAGYQTCYELHKMRETFPAFQIPIVCLPASINNNLPGAENSVGADTALNVIMEAVDKIKQSAVASKRCFVVEVMGNYCGFLALMSALATGAERVYLNEEGVSLTNLKDDLDLLIEGFSKGKRLGLMIRNEKANAIYSTQFMRALFEEEGGALFEVRDAVLGHIQQGGNPTPFDRIQAVRMADYCVRYLEEQAESTDPEAACIGLTEGEMRFTHLDDMHRMMDLKYQRPKQQWWMDLRPVVSMLAQPSPGFRK